MQQVVWMKRWRGSTDVPSTLLIYSQQSSFTPDVSDVSVCGPLSSPTAFSPQPVDIYKVVRMKRVTRKHKYK